MVRFHTFILLFEPMNINILPSPTTSVLPARTLGSPPSLFVISRRGTKVNSKQPEPCLNLWSPRTGFNELLLVWSIRATDRFCRFHGRQRKSCLGCRLQLVLLGCTGGYRQRRRLRGGNWFRMFRCHREPEGQLGMVVLLEYDMA